MTAPGLASVETVETAVARILRMRIVSSRGSIDELAWEVVKVVRERTPPPPAGPADDPADLDAYQLALEQLLTAINRHGVTLSTAAVASAVADARELLNHDRGAEAGP